MFHRDNRDCEKSRPFSDTAGSGLDAQVVEKEYCTLSWGRTKINYMFIK